MANRRPRLRSRRARLVHRGGQDASQALTWPLRRVQRVRWPCWRRRLGVGRARHDPRARHRWTALRQRAQAGAPTTGNAQVRSRLRPFPTGVFSIARKVAALDHVAHQLADMRRGSVAGGQVPWVLRCLRCLRCLAVRTFFTSSRRPAGPLAPPTRRPCLRSRSGRPSSRSAGAKPTSFPGRRVAQRFTISDRP